ncbi:MAG TPA: heavy metal-associated domain-containing protein [Dehalococcoidia bacterium]|nr:heavy metal-associated domain-containing protein [Dehalococcoidia bacterium]
MDDEGATPLALPVLGIESNSDRARALEAVLRRLQGVVRAYVSPFTALAYVDYHATQISEAQLVGAIAGAGYRVDDRQRRFPWRRS